MVYYVERTMQLVSKDCPRPISDDGVWTVVGEIQTKPTGTPPPFFLDTAFNLLLFKLKYCYKTSSVQASTVILVLRLSAIL